MIDIKLLRESPEQFRDSLKNRGGDPSIVDTFLELDQKWKENVKKINDLRAKRNSMSLQISERVKQKKDTENIKSEVRQLNQNLLSIEEEQKDVEENRDKIASRMPNLLDPEVPICFGDENSKFIKFSGKARVKHEDLDDFMKSTEGKGIYESIAETFSHVDMGESMHLFDLERAGKIAGSRFYFSKNQLVKLELALVNYAIDFMGSRNFSIVEPPPMITEQAVWKATDEGTFNESIYKIEGEICISYPHRSILLHPCSWMR
jgi:Seryl-tRNA synthetase